MRLNRCKIWELVKALEEDDILPMKRELLEARATMLVNFGRDGRTIKGLIEGNETLTQMIVMVFEYYQKR